MPSFPGESCAAPYHARKVAVDELVLDGPSLARALGYAPAPPQEPGAGELPVSGSARPMPEHVRELIERALAEARPLLEPQWMWTVVPVRLERDSLRCLNGRSTVLEIGGIVRSQLRGSEAVALFVISIGPRLERHARELLLDPERSLEGYVLDTIGSVAVEAAGDRLETEIAGVVADRGWKITNRFSPGYCTWETAGQHALFSLFPERPAGVSLSDSSLMSPIKSISGVIGLGSAVEHRPYMCDICSMTTCHQRLVHARL